MINKNFETVIELVNKNEAELTNGGAVVLRSYLETKENYPSEDQPIIIKGFTWENEYADSLAMLAVGEIEQFILADNSTGLMKTLTFLIDNGWEIAATEEFEVGYNNQMEKGLLIRKK